MSAPVIGDRVRIRPGYEMSTHAHTRRDAWTDCEGVIVEASKGECLIELSDGRAVWIVAKSDRLTILQHSAGCQCELCYPRPSAAEHEAREAWLDRTDRYAHDDESDDVAGGEP